MMKNIIPSGRVEFYLDEHGVTSRKFVFSEIEKKMINSTIYGDIFTGEEFVELIKHKFIVDYDGSMRNVWIDGCVSNLGITCSSFSQGEFKVSLRVWKSICKEHKVEVEWCNR